MDTRLIRAHRPFQISAVLFHLEGTLARTEDRPLKAAVGCPEGAALIDFIRGLRDAGRRRRALAELDRREQAAASEWPLPSSVPPLFAWMRARGLRIGVFSRHGRKAVGLFLKKVRPALGRAVRPCLLREELLAASGRRNPFRTAAERLQVLPRETLVVSAERGVLDLAAAAGAVTVLVSGGPPPPGSAPSEHFRIADLRQVKAVLRLGLPLPPGKLPNDLLKEFLDEFKFEDPALLVHPGVGEDIAAVDVAADEVLVLKSDPITFATDAIGQYAVLVNANDIATAGAVPRWLLTTLLFPAGSTPSLIWSVVSELQEFTRRWGITLCGGHTEVTDAVRRPVIAGMMAGTVRRRDLIDKRQMRTGDRILLTKAVAVEGTAILAREFGRRLKALGMTAGEIQFCRDFLDRISILPEAAAAAAVKGTSAMHDVTEGGIATALAELSAAGGFELRVETDRIPIFPETRRLCRLLGVQPLGLIGSGSLLICCRPKSADRVEANLRREGIAVARIGAVGEPGAGIRAFKSGRPAAWPSFEVDEIARLFAKERRA
jgi:hydrogenase expression/formation protein HypE